MRNLLLILFLCNLALSLVTGVIGPDPLATHFGPGGEPNGWSSPAENALIMLGVSLLLFGMFYGSPILFKRLPARWINLPHRDFWLSEERRSDTVDILVRELYAMGTATLLLMLIVGLLGLQANLSEPVHLKEIPVWGALGLYFAYTGYWCIRLFLRFRIPVTETSGRNTC